jgi:hypothetical protein
MTTIVHPLRSRVLRSAAAFAAVAGLGLAVAACGDDDSSSSASTEAPASGEVTVTGAWARTSPMNVENGAAYFTITSPTDDKLVDVKVDASVAAMAQIHETVMATADTSMSMDTSMTSGTDMGGAMTMQEVDSVDLPAGQAVVFEPGGYHVMLMMLAAPLEKGATFQLTLVLENAGEITVDVVVADEAP